MCCKKPLELFTNSMLFVILYKLFMRENISGVKRPLENYLAVVILKPYN